MRWVILVLIVANLALFSWFSFRDPDNVRSMEEGRLPRVAEIELIGQQGGEPPSDSDGPADIMPVATEPQEDDERPVNGAVASGARPEVDIEAVDDTVRLDPEPARQCFGIGWFEEESTALDYRQGLGGDPGYPFIGVTEQEEALPPFHWVIIPPFDTRDQALDRYRELVARGIEAYVVPSGERENAISLGLFRSLRSAEGVLQRRQAQNINAILVKFPRNRISYALVFEGVSPESLDVFGGSSGPGEVGLQLIEFSDCEGVATAKKNP